MSVYEESRKNIRYIKQDQLFVQLLSGKESIDVVNKRLYCHYHDASISGLKIELDIKFTPESLLDLWFVFEGNQFYLRGRVCWCEQTSSDRVLYKLGIELEDMYGTDYVAWTKLINNFLDE